MTEKDTFVYDEKGAGKLVSAEEAASLIESGEYSDSPAPKPKGKKKETPKEKPATEPKGKK